MNSVGETRCATWVNPWLSVSELAMNQNAPSASLIAFFRLGGGVEVWRSQRSRFLDVHRPRVVLCYLPKPLHDLAQNVPPDVMLPLQRDLELSDGCISMREGLRNEVCKKELEDGGQI